MVTTKECQAARLSSSSLARRAFVVAEVAVLPLGVAGTVAHIIEFLEIVHHIIPARNRRAVPNLEIALAHSRIMEYRIAAMSPFSKLERRSSMTSSESAKPSLAAASPQASSPRDSRNESLTVLRACEVLKAFRAQGEDLSLTNKRCAVVGQNAVRETRDELRRPGTRLIGTVAYFPERYGDELISLALGMLRNKSVPASVFVKHQLITPDNVDLHYPLDNRAT